MKTNDSSVQTGTFVLTGEFWTIGYGGVNCTLKNTLGLSYLQRLLQHPGEEFHALDLLAGPGMPASQEADEARLRSGDELTRGRPSDLGAMLDPRAKQEFKRKIEELTEELEELQERGAHEQAEKVADEIDKINSALLSSMGLGGRDRKTGAASEKARINVTRHLRTAIERIAEHHDELAKLLGESIRTGTYCCYLPKSRVDWNFAAENVDGSGAVPAALTPPPVPASAPEFSPALPELTGFIGRTAERELIGASLRRVMNGENGIVMISGAAGIGKTRLARALGADARRLGFVTLSGNCYDREDSVPYIPMVEILEAALAQNPTPASFRAVLGAETAEITRLMPQLRKLFPDIPQPLQGTPEQARRALFNALVEIVARQSRLAPLLLLIEDVHWADEGTLAMVAHFARAMTGLRVLVMLTYRDDAIDPASQFSRTLDDLLRFQVEHVRLRGLPQIEVRAMVEALGGGGMSRYLLDAIYSYTEGNPLFVQELVRHLINNQPMGVSLEVAAHGEIDLPHSLRLVIGRRLARVGKETQKMLGTAAVIGRSFTFPLLEAATQVDADELVELVEEAEKAGLITSRLRYPDAEFRFAHELIRRAVLDDLLSVRRQRLHLSVARALELVHANALEDHAEDLAHQLWNAGSAADADKTIHYLQLAGTKAVQTAANVDAIGHFTNALTLLSRLKETPERLQQELLIQTTLGAPLVATRGFSSLEVRSVYTRARELSQRVGQSPQLFLIVWGQWLNYASRSEWETARQLGEQCLQLAEEANDSALLIEAHHALGVSCICEAEFVKGLDHCDQVIALYDPARHAAHVYTYGQDPAAICHIHAAHARWFLGYPEQALQRVAVGLALGRKQTHPGNLATIAAFAALVQQISRNVAAVQELAATAVKISTEHELAFPGGMGTILSGWALTQLGRSEQGIAQMEQGMAGMRAADAVMLMPYFSSLLAEAYGDAGRLQEAWELLAELDPRREPYWEAELHRLKGELILKRCADQNSPTSSHLQAEECFRKALAVARAQTGKSLELRAAMSLARLWLQQRKPAAADDLLTEVFAWFTEGFATPDLREAKALLEQVRTPKASISQVNLPTMKGRAARP